MGIGFVVIVPPKEAENVLKELNKTTEASIIGKVISEEKIIIKTFEGTEIEY